MERRGVSSRSAGTLHVASPLESRRSPKSFPFQQEHPSAGPDSALWCTESGSHNPPISQLLLLTLPANTKITSVCALDAQFCTAVQHSSHTKHWRNSQKHEQQEETMLQVLSCGNQRNTCRITECFFFKNINFNAFHSSEQGSNTPFAIICTYILSLSLKRIYHIYIVAANRQAFQKWQKVKCVFLYLNGHFCSQRHLICMWSEAQK